MASKKRVLVTGAGGLLGTEVVTELLGRGHEPVSKTRQELDISDPESVAQIAVEAFGKIDWCINCAAYTAVDKAESEEQLANDVNGFGVSLLGQCCKSVNCRLIHISTDFVFDGSSSEPYDEESATNPLGAYGRSKLAGERSLFGNHLALVVRTSWLYGPHGACFPRTILRAYEAGKTLRVVADQVGNPTYTPDLARVLVDLIELDPFPGIYHAVGPDSMSWHAFASLAIEVCTGSKPNIEAIRTEDWPTPAVRPKYSVLSTAKLQGLGVAQMRPVRESLEAFCASRDSQ